MLGGDFMLGGSQPCYRGDGGGSVPGSHRGGQQRRFPRSHPYRGQHQQHQQQFQPQFFPHNSVSNNNYHQLHQRARKMPHMEDHGVRRQRECPCAVRVYALPGSDVVTRSEFSSVVLGVPSVGIIEAVAPVLAEPSAGRTSLLPEYQQQEGVLSSSVECVLAAPVMKSVTPAEKIKPVAVVMTWADTTLFDLSLAALKALRREADASFTVSKTPKQDPLEQEGTNEKEEEGEASAGNAKAAGAAVGTSNNTTADKAADPLSGEASLAHYVLEWMSGNITAEGRASLRTIGAVEVRQVVPGCPHYYPVRRANGVDYNSVLMDVPYTLGDPMFVTCSRTR